GLHSLSAIAWLFGNPLFRNATPFLRRVSRNLRPKNVYNVSELPLRLINAPRPHKRCNALPLRHVVLRIDSPPAYGRGLLHGVTPYLREGGSWSVYLRPRGLDAPPPSWLRRWRGDGILARIDDRRMATEVRRAARPTVELRGVIPNLGFPFIGPD